MAKVVNMFREFSMINIRGYNQLSNFQKNMFDKTYKKHLSSMNMRKRMNYTENHIKKVAGEISVIKVYFDNGECYIYLKDHRWVRID